MRVERRIGQGGRKEEREVMTGEECKNRNSQVGNDSGRQDKTGLLKRSV